MITIKLVEKNVCGKPMYYPNSNDSKLYFRIFKRKALSLKELKSIKELIKSEKSISAEIEVRKGEDK
jgi:hypothetical protein